MLNDKTKNKYRRVIRGVMIILAVVLLVMGLAVPIANNALAMSVARELEALPMPADTALVESTSLAGRFEDTAGSVQYFAALLVKSDRPLEELRAHYVVYNEGLHATYRVEPQSGQEIAVLDDISLAFREKIATEGYYIVYTLRTGGHAAQWWLDMDVRG